MRWLLVAAVGALAAVIPASAQAGVDVHLIVQNQTQYKLKVFGTDNECWYLDDLDPGRAPVIKTGEQLKLNSETKSSQSCYASRGFQNLELAFERAGGGFPGSLGGADAFRYHADQGTLDMHWTGSRLTLRGVPLGWLPVNPEQSGTQAGSSQGPFCLIGKELNSEHVLLTVRSLAQDFRDGCTPKASAIRGRPARPPSGLRAAPINAAPRGNVGVVWDLFQIGKAACALTHPLTPWGSSPCDDIANVDAWDLHNVTADVKSAKSTTDPRVVTASQQLSPDTFDNLEGAGPATFKWEYKYKKGDETSTGTETALKVGGKIEWAKKFAIPIIGDFEQKLELSIDHEWKKSEEQKHSVEQEVTKGVDVHIEPHTKTWVFIKQTQATLLFHFTADLTAGVAGTAQPIKTPMTRSLGISAARNHPCIGYLAGSNPNSLMGLNAYARSQGISPQTVGLPEEQRAFLEAAPSLSVSASDRCPGFPAGFPAAFAFNGTAAYSGQAGGPTTAGSFAPNLPAVEACAYSEHAPHSSFTQAPAVAGASCKPGPTPPAASSDGDVVLGHSFGVGATVKGGNRDSLILTDCTHRDYRTGLGDDIVMGTGRCHVPVHVVVGGGDDIINGGLGNDWLIGGRGSDTLNGGPGNDRLIDTHGKNIALFGGPGNDTLIATSKSRGGLFGGPGNDTLIMHGKGPVVLAGGAGNDTYHLLGGASSTSVFELPGQGVDTIYTDHSMTMPPDVEIARSSTHRGITLRGGAGSERLIGSNGNDTLIAGPGSDYLAGGGGHNTLVLSPFGFTEARGGPGRNRFLVLSQPPVNPALWAGMRLSNLPISAKSADVIDDFHAGDRLVLSTRSFGAALRKLRGHIRITIGANARGRGAQFTFFPARGLLSFDADGQGGAPPVVVAILKGRRSLSPSAIQITR